ncbi:MAG: VOC family protein [Candidatus Cloacimonadota bacterium]|nr:VOC family protein [Candidatus Cloacimonadota bacterium]
MLKHIGITVNDKNDVKNFYQDLLGLKLKKEFKISKDLNQQIFGFYEDVPVYLLSDEDMEIEIFVTHLPARKNYSHLCIEVEKRKMFIEKAKTKNYKCIVIQRDKSDLVFVKDKFGNMFEIKEHGEK